MTETNWQLQEAKARLSELVKTAQRAGPQQITVRGKPVAVVLARGDYDKLIADKPRFVDFLGNSPLKGISLNVRRDKSTARDIKL